MDFKQICYPPVFIIKDSVKKDFQIAYIIYVIFMIVLFFDTPSYFELMYIMLTVLVGHCSQKLF